MVYLHVIYDQTHSSSLLISVLILLCCTEAGKCLMVITSVGDDAVLPCEIDPTIDPTFNFNAMAVEWNRRDLPQDQYVHFQRNSKEYVENKNHSFVGRTSVFIDEFKKGNMSLKLSKVKSSDDGNYTCFLPDFNKKFTIQLVVVSRPIITVARPVVAVVGEDVILPCQANFTVPVSETTVKWTRNDLTPQNVHVIKNGQEVSVEQNSVYKDRTSVFVEELEVGNVSLRISGVKLSDGGNYTCFITSGKVEECVVQLTVVGHFPWWGFLIIILIIIIIIIIISGLVYYKIQSNQEFDSRAETPAGDENSPMNVVSNVSGV